MSGNPNICMKWQERQEEDFEGMKKQAKVRLWICYITFFTTGMMAIGIGALLPYIIEEAGLNYRMGGGLLALYSAGSILAGVVNPCMIKRRGSKNAAISMMLFIPLSLSVLTITRTVSLLYMASLILGTGIGAASLFCNTAVNENSGKKGTEILILHTICAAGACSAPLIMSFYIYIGLTWRALACTISLLFVISIALIMVFFSSKEKRREIEKTEENNISYIKSSSFRIYALILFFYVGLESSVNGWFITYFKSKGIMGEKDAINLITFMWITVTAGRLLTVYWSKKIRDKTLLLIYSISTAVFFTLLLASTNLPVITIVISLLGVSFAGIYPICVAGVGKVINGSVSGMSAALVMGPAGGILMTQSIGIMADQVSLEKAVGLVFLNVICLLLLSIVNYTS